MVKFIVALVIVVALVLGGLMAFRRNSRLGQPSPEVLERAKVREREIEAKERADADD